MLHKFLGFCLLAMLTACAGNHAGIASSKAEPRPNILIIVADDMGYSDMGAFGGEIPTPNLDALAGGGIRLTGMHAAPSCSPTRAMLLSGADNHVAGLGAMAEHIPAQYKGRRGFEGVLSDRVATLAERFAAADYRTIMSGKWHLGMADGKRPAQRGFQSSFALLQGAANHFGHGGFGKDDGGLGGATYVEDDKPFQPAGDFYSSNIIATKLIGQLNKGDMDKPFFAYLSFTAPHSPLQAPKADIARHAQKYQQGWAHLARSRGKKMQALGVLPGMPSNITEKYRQLQESWDGLTPQKKAIEARRMAIYAAMVDNMDHNIGDVLAALRKSGQMENTIILFLSDNGPAGEDPRQYAVVPGFTDQYESADNSLSNMGAADSFVLQSQQWARAIAAPSRLFKGFVTEGGTLVPAILHHPSLPKGKINKIQSDVRDITPTLLAMANISQSNIVNGKKTAAIEGRDLLPLLKNGKNIRPAKHVIFAFNGQSIVRANQWKAMRIPAPMGDGLWHLYNIQNDPAEMQDQKEEQPQLFAEMMESWVAYADLHGLNGSANAPFSVHPEGDE